MYGLFGELTFLNHSAQEMVFLIKNGQRVENNFVFQLHL